MHTIYESFGTRIFFVQSLVFRWCLSFMFVFWLLGYEISVWGWRVKLLKHFCNYECGTRGQSILRDAISWNMGVLYLRHLPHAGVSTQFLIPPFSGFFRILQGVTVLCLWNSSNPPCANPEYSVNSPNFCWSARGVVEVSLADCCASAFMLLEPLIATSRGSNFSPSSLFQGWVQMDVHHILGSSCADLYKKIKGFFGPSWVSNMEIW